MKLSVQLHHDILREMGRADLLVGLTFIGGTCLRDCYGSPRLSEDLDFTGGSDFKASQLTRLGEVLEKTLTEKYGLPVKVSDPVREKGNVSTWKLRIETRPATKHLPAQRIHIDICAVPSHQPRPSFLRNSYNIDMGTGGLIIQAQSRREILADKWLALALRINRLRYRDLWDVIWLNQQGIRLEPSLLALKLEERSLDWHFYIETLSARIDSLENDPNHQKSFKNELERFLPASEIDTLINQPEFWDALIIKLRTETEQLKRTLIHLPGFAEIMDRTRY